MAKPTDFIVLCHPRSGSNLLLWALSQHNAVQMSGEIFNDMLDAHDAGLPPGVEPYRPGMNGGDFLKRSVFPLGRDTPPQARGFKLFYEHARSDAAAQTAWSHLIADRRIHVIHLIRRNLFDCLVSLEVALQTGEWYRSVEARDGPPAVAPFSIAPWTCQEYFGRITSWQIWATQAFARHPMLTVDYGDDLCADFAGTMARIHGFIGVAPLPVTPSLERQATTAPAQQILNYAELQSWFRHSLFEGFFPADRA